MPDMRDCAAVIIARAAMQPVPTAVSTATYKVPRLGISIELGRSHGDTSAPFQRPSTATFTVEEPASTSQAPTLAPNAAAARPGLSFGSRQPSIFRPGSTAPAAPTTPTPAFQVQHTHLHRSFSEEPAMLLATVQVKKRQRDEEGQEDEEEDAEDRMRKERKGVQHKEGSGGDCQQHERKQGAIPTPAEQAAVEPRKRQKPDPSLSGSSSTTPPPLEQQKVSVRRPIKDGIDRSKPTKEAPARQLFDQATRQSFGGEAADASTASVPLELPARLQYDGMIIEAHNELAVPVNPFDMVGAENPQDVQHNGQSAREELECQQDPQTSQHAPHLDRSQPQHDAKRKMVSHRSVQQRQSDEGVRLPYHQPQGQLQDSVPPTHNRPQAARSACNHSEDELRTHQGAHQSRSRASDWAGQEVTGNRTSNDATETFQAKVEYIDNHLFTAQQQVQQRQSTFEHDDSAYLPQLSIFPDQLLSDIAHFERSVDLSEQVFQANTSAGGVSQTIASGVICLELNYFPSSEQYIDKHDSDVIEAGAMQDRSTSSSYEVEQSLQSNDNDYPMDPNDTFGHNQSTDWRVLVPGTLPAQSQHTQGPFEWQYEMPRTTCIDEQGDFVTSTYDDIAPAPVQGEPAFYGPSSHQYHPDANADARARQTDIESDYDLAESERGVPGRYELVVHFQRAGVGLLVDQQSWALYFDEPVRALPRACN